MNRAKKTFYILLAVNVLFLLGIAGVYVFASKFAKQKSTSIALAKADVETNDQLITSFKELERSLQKSAELEAIAKEVLPQDKNQSLALNEIQQFGQEVGITIKQVTFNAPAGAKNTGPTLTSPTSLKGVSVLSVTVRCDKMEYEKLLEFLQKIEGNRRRMQVTSISLAPSSSTLGLLERVDLTMDIYLKP